MPPGAPGAPNFMSMQRAAPAQPRKAVIATTEPMRPLYWKAVKIHEIRDPTFDAKTTIWDKLEEPSLDTEELVSFFSKTNKKKSEKKVDEDASKKPEKAKKIEMKSLLDQKRSQNVGIFCKSFKINAENIEKVLDNFGKQDDEGNELCPFDFDSLRALKDLGADKEELALINDYKSMIKEAEAVKDDSVPKPMPLDKPEQFLSVLSEIKFLQEKIDCFDFQDKFKEQHADIIKGLDYLEKTTKFLSTEMKEDAEIDENGGKSPNTSSPISSPISSPKMSPKNSPRNSISSKSSVISKSLSQKITKTKDSPSEQTDLYKILGLILAIGNYLNGGNKARGQADGFGLETLAKLRDLKSHDGTNLLAYIIRLFIRKYKQDADEADLDLPVPKVTDIIKSSETDFEMLEGEQNRLKKQMEDCRSKIAKIDKLKPADKTESLLAFQKDITKFLDSSEKQLEILRKRVNKVEENFTKLYKKFYVQPKKRGGKVKCEDFFGYWTSFCAEFKEIWEKEVKKLLKNREKELKAKVEELRALGSVNDKIDGKDVKKSGKTAHETKKVKEGGLKDRLRAKRLKKEAENAEK